MSKEAPGTQRTTKEDSLKAALAAAAKAIAGMQYGDVTIKVEGGKPIFVEARTRERVG